MNHSTFQRTSEIDASATQLRDWHFADGAFEKLSPPWEKAQLIEPYGELTDGCRAVIEVSIGPIKQRWVAVHEITETGFIDRQESGPFAFWEHHHQFLPISTNTSQLIDRIHYRLPLGWLGYCFGNPYIRRKLNKLFHYRHEVTKAAFAQ